MNSDRPDGKCASCGGDRVTGRTIFAAQIEDGVLVVRDVPATVCSQCGEEWIDDDVTARLTEIAEDARRRRVQLEVVTLSDVA